MKSQNRLTTSSQAQETALSGQETQQQSAREFANAEELLRHDALHTPVPPAIGHRLQDSIGRVPPSKPSWWRKLFGAQS